MLYSNFIENILGTQGVKLKGFEFKGNIYEVTHAGKKTGILTGIIGGLAGGIVKLCKGEALSKAFTLKSLAVKIPVFALAGWAIGSVLDAFTNSASAKQADELPKQV